MDTHTHAHTHTQTHTHAYTHTHTHHFKEGEFIDVGWEILQVVVSHVQSSQTASEVGKICGERGADEVVVGEIKYL